MVNVPLAQEARGAVAVVDAKLPARPVAIGVHRGLGHAQLAGDLLGRQVLIHQPQAVALPGRKEPDQIFGDFASCAHDASSKRRLAPRVYFKAKARQYALTRRDGTQAMELKDAGRAAQLELAIGARLRTRRRQLGMSQSDLADVLGVSFQQVQKYERGANRVAASTLLAAAQALSTSVGWLLGEDHAGREDDDHVFRALARPGALEILQAFNAIPSAQARAALLALTREMAAPAGGDPSLTDL
jgi:transcriptional regulator with XRE-family HTH domain